MFSISLLRPNTQRYAIEDVGYLKSPQKSYQIISLTKEELTLQEKRFIDSLLYLIYELGVRIAGICGKQIQNPYDFSSVEEILKTHVKEVESIDDDNKLDVFAGNFDQEPYKSFALDLSVIKGKSILLKKRRKEGEIARQEQEEKAKQDEIRREAFLKAVSGTSKRKVPTTLVQDQQQKESEVVNKTSLPDSSKGSRLLDLYAKREEIRKKKQERAEDLAEKLKAAQVKPLMPNPSEEEDLEGLDPFEKSLKKLQEYLEAYQESNPSLLQKIASLEEDSLDLVKVLQECLEFIEKKIENIKPQGRNCEGLSLLKAQLEVGLLQNRLEAIDLKAISKKYQETTIEILEKNQAIRGGKLSTSGKNLFYSAKTYFSQRLSEREESRQDQRRIQTVMEVFSKEITYSETFAETILAIGTTFAFIEKKGYVESFENRQTVGEKEFYKLMYASYILSFKDTNLSLKELHRFNEGFLKALESRDLKQIFTWIEEYRNGEKESLTESFKKELKALFLLEGVRRNFSPIDLTEEEVGAIAKVLSFELLRELLFIPQFHKVVLKEGLKQALESWQNSKYRVDAAGNRDLEKEYQSLEDFINVFYALALETFLKGKREEEEASFQKCCEDFLGTSYGTFYRDMVDLQNHIQEKTPSFSYIQSDFIPWIAILKRLTSVEGDNKLQTIFSFFDIEIELHDNEIVGEAPNAVPIIPQEGQEDDLQVALRLSREEQEAASRRAAEELERELNGQ